MKQKYNLSILVLTAILIISALIYYFAKSDAEWMCAGTAFHSTGPIIASAVACACIVLQHSETSDKSLCHDCDACEEGSDERAPCLESKTRT